MHGLALLCAEERAGVELTVPSGFSAVMLPGVGVHLSQLSWFPGAVLMCVGGALKQEVILPVVTPEILNDLVYEGPTPTRAVRVS